MRSFCSLTRNIVLKPKLNPQLTFRTFTATPPHHKYQTPAQKKDKIMSTTTTLKGQPLDRQVLDSMLRRRMFYTPSFEIYNGVAGLVSNKSFIQCSQCPIHLHVSTSTTLLLPHKFSNSQLILGSLSLEITDFSCSMIMVLPVAPCRRTLLTYGANISSWKKICWNWTARH